MPGVAQVVRSDIVAEKGVFLELETVKEVEQFAEKLEKDMDFRNQ
jgi:hypothetical protein